MARIEKSIGINATAEKIWPMVYWDRVPEWMDAIKKAAYTSEYKDRLGATAHVMGDAGSIKAEWDAETTEWTENERFGWRTFAGSFTGFGSMTLTSIEAGTKATFLMDYDLPYSFLGKLVDKLRVQKAMEKSVDVGLKKLKDMLEA